MTTISINSVNLNIPADDLKDIQAALQVLQTKLLPHLITLSPTDRRELPKLGERNIPFANKTRGYAQANPQFVPSFIDVNELEAELSAVDILTQLQHPLDQLASSVDDTLMAVGSNALSACLSFYSSVKDAAKRRIHGAKEIADDLGQRFPGHTRATDSTPKT